MSPSLPTTAQNHHESALPSQRYKARNSVPATLNPIIPADLSEEDMALIGQMPASFHELNAPPQRPPALGNPLFGYSVHPPPPPIATFRGIGATQRSDSAASGMSSASRARMEELQAELEHERKLRKSLEDQLNLPK